MRSPLLAAAVLLSTLASTVLAAAQDDPATEEGATEEGTTEQVRRDPKGVRGISPFWEAVKRGDNAYVARDYDASITAYTEALTKEPKNALGHYRIGEAHRAKGDLANAEKAWQAALRFVVGDPALRAKILFVLADLQERKEALPQARDGWSTYEAHVQGQSASVGYAETGVERRKRIAVWIGLQEKYASVKQRISRRLSEVDEKARADAAKDAK